MTTYLLSRHYSLSLITFVRTVISIIEISSTIIFPIAASFLAEYPLDLIPNPIAALGLSSVSTQVVFTIPCYIALVLVPINMTDPASTFPLLSASIFLSLGFSGFGYWTHNVAGSLFRHQRHWGRQVGTKNGVIIIASDLHVVLIGMKSRSMTS